MTTGGAREEPAGGVRLHVHALAVLARMGDKPLVDEVPAATLARDALALARWLQERGEGVVAFRLTRDPRLVVALLGAMCSGRTFLALDPELPDARQRQLLDDACASLLICDGAGPGGPTEIASWPELEPGTPTTQAADVDVAVLMYTSGTTGRPKGVQLTHEGLLAAVQGLCEAWELDAHARLPALSSVAFDMALLELLVPLVVGAHLCLCSRETARDGRALARVLRDRTHLVATPTTLRALVRSGWQPPGPVKVLSGGEALERELVDALQARGCVVFNGYGPAEATICALVDRVEQGPVTIGRPLPGVTAQVIDGQLALGGPALARGYQGDTLLTASRFVRVDGCRVYLTGDRVEQRDDGRFTFLGRVDDQVKIRGNRIEPAEVEAALRAVHGIREGAVVVDRGVATRLVAFYAGDVAPDVVRSALRAVLPAPAVPALVLKRLELPVSANGKIDRQALVVPRRPAALGSPEPAATEDEERLVARATALLGAPVGVLDDLFALGLDSLQVVELCEDEAFAPRDVYRSGQLRALARIERAVVSAGAVDGAPATPPQSALVLLHALDAEHGALRVAATLTVSHRSTHEVVTAMGTVLGRHASLRTVVRQGRQVVLPDGPVLHGWPADVDALARTLHPVDGPVAAWAVRTIDGVVEVLLVVHHVAVDWRSLGVVAVELDAALRGRELPPPLHLAAFAARQPRGEVEVQALARTLDEAPVLGLPAGRGTGVGQLVVAVDRPEGPGTELARWLARTAAALFSETGQLDQVLGTLADLRRSGEDHLVGFCANPIPVRVRLDAAGTLGDVGRVVALALREAMAWQDVPFATLQRARATPGPLRVCVAVQDRPPSGEVTLTEWPSESVAYDLLIEVLRGAGGRRLKLSWRRPALDDAAAERLVAAISRAPDVAEHLGDRAPWLPVTEARLLELGSVRDAAVARRTRADGQVVTVGWYVPVPHAPRVPPAAGELDHLIPVARLPLTVTGHLDLGALHAVADAPPHARPWSPPATPARLARPAPSPPPGAPSASQAGPSLLEAEPLVLPAGAPRTLAEVLERAAQGARSVVHVEERDVRVAWTDLLGDAQRVAGGLAAAGIRRGDEVVVVVGASRHALPAIWGCLLAGVAAVPLARPPDYVTSTAALERLRVVWESLGKPPVLVPPGDAPTGTLAGAVLLDLGSLLWSEPAPPTCQPEDIAVLLLTSGSTGVPKPVVQTHESVIAFLESYTQRHGFGAGDVYLNWLGLDHVAPLFMVHFTAAYHGGEQVNAPFAGLLARPASGLEQIHRHRATTTFAPNFVFGLLAEAAEAAVPGSLDLSCFDKVTNGGESIVPRTARRFLVALGAHGLPEHAMVPIWGMSETCSATITSLDFRLAGTDDADPFTALGGPTPGFALRIVDELGAVVPRGVVGRLEVRGPQVTPGYLRRPDANAESFGEGGWFDTGDLGFVDDGGLTLTGRAKDVIIVHGVNFYSHEIEAVVDATEGVRRSFSAAVAHREPGDETDRLVVFYVPESTAPPELEAELVARIHGGAGITPSRLVAVEARDIPKTAIGKIQRSKLRERLVAGAFPDPGARPAWTFRAVWRPRRVRRERSRGATVVGSLDELAMAPGTAVVDLRALAGGDLHSLLGIVWEHAERLRDEVEPELLVVTRGALGDDAVCPGGAALAGALSCLGQERPGLRARLLDLPPAPDPRESAWIVQELSELGRHEPEVLRRGGCRLVRRLVPGQLPAGPLPWSDGDGVVISGALGGVGRVLLDVLADRRLRVLALGRSAEPDLAGVPSRLEVSYAPCDLGTGAVDAIVRDWEGGRPAVAFFHLAAQMPVVPLSEQTVELVRDVLRPRSAGTDALARLALERDAIWVDFGSVNEFLGGFGVSAYAAGCRYGEARMAVHRARGGRGQRLIWTAWQDRGVTAGLDVRSANRRRGFHAIDREAGAEDLRAALADGGDWVLGLDATSAPTRALVQGAPLTLLGHTSAGSDGFGTAWRLVEEPSVREERPAVAPLRGEVERQVAAIWCEVLGRSEVGADVSFFELGGHSLLLVEVQARLEQAFARPVPAAELFRNPTVRALARHLAGDDAPPPPDRARSRADRMKARTRTLRGRRRG